MRTPPRDDLRFSNTTGILWFIGVEVEQETNAPPPKKNPRSAPDNMYNRANIIHHFIFVFFLSFFSTTLPAVRISLLF